MHRPNRRRILMLVILLAPALAIFLAAWRADAQPGGFGMEMTWKCSKCGGNLGNGVSPPPTCPRCGAKIRPPAFKNNWPDSPAPRAPQTTSKDASGDGWTAGRFIAILVAGGAVIVLGFLVMKDWGPQP